jgi:hypothetical protein
MAKITSNNTKEINNLTTSVAVILGEIKSVNKELERVVKKMDCFGDAFVCQKEFKLTNKHQDERIGKIEKLVYGAVGLALLTLGKAVLDLVVTVQAR